jgi:hypothetical protein
LIVAIVSARIQAEDSAMLRRSSARSSRRKKVTHDHPIFTRWPAQYPDRLQLLSAPTPNGVKVGIVLEETSLAYEPHRIDIMADESHDPALAAVGAPGDVRRPRTSFLAFCRASQERAVRLLSRHIETMISVRRPTKESRP